jgi:hypothetical protein
MTPDDLHAAIADCIGHIIDASDVPVPPPDHPEPWTVWRVWLAERRLGLVPIADPQRFAWPGPWLAILSDQRAAVGYGTPQGGFSYAPRGARFEDVEAGYLVAPHHLTSPPATGGGAHGTVEAIAIAPAAEAPMELIGEARAHAGRGLEGDRYVDGRGTFSNSASKGHDLTLIDAAVVEELGLAPEEARRNVVTRGIDLDALVGERFRVGDVECVGRRLCEPCSHLQRLTHDGILPDLVHRGGLRADILGDGVIRVGDAVGPATAG